MATVSPGPTSPISTAFLPIALVGSYESWRNMLFSLSALHAALQLAIFQLS